LSAFPIALALAAFGASLAVHIAWWRRGRPRRDMRALFFLFLLAAPAAAAGAGISCAASGAGPSTGEVAIGVLLSLALGSAYVQTYPAAQAGSPSLRIIARVRAAGSGGLSRNELAEGWAVHELVGDRVEDLVANGLVERVGDELRVSPAARHLVRFFVAYRRLLGLAHKGG
jgi:hypothetical protein